MHPFFDELRDPSTRLPDSRHANGGTKDLPPLFNFTLHGESTLNMLFVGPECSQSSQSSP